jgi:hypothetical protein
MQPRVPGPLAAGPPTSVRSAYRIGHFCLQLADKIGQMDSLDGRGHGGRFG